VNKQNYTHLKYIKGIIPVLSDPNGECVFNVSKETTVKEIISIDGVDEYTQRMQGINLSGGATNAVEFCCNLFKMPSLVDLLQAFEEDLKAGDKLEHQI
jgi:hypothetical protein